MSAPKPRFGRPLAQIAVGAVLGAVALWLAFRGVDLAALARAIRFMDWSWAGGALAATVLSLFIAAWRWRLLFYPEHGRQRASHLFRAIVVGQAINIVLPLRLGEVARVYAAAQDGSVSKMQALATIAVEKALDLAVFGCSIALLVACMTLPVRIVVRPTVVLLTAAGGWLALWIVARSAPTVTKAARALTARLGGRWAIAGSGAAERFMLGLRALRSHRASIGSAGLTVGMVAAGVACNYLLLRAFDLAVPPIAALFLFVVLQVGAVPPSLPGRIGIFNYVAVLGLSVFGVDRQQAVAYSLMLYAVAFLPKILLAAVYLGTSPSGARLAGVSTAGEPS